MIRRPPRSTQSRSSAASDVYKRQGSAEVRCSRRSRYRIPARQSPPLRPPGCWSERVIEQRPSSSPPAPVAPTRPSPESPYTCPPLIPAPPPGAPPESYHPCSGQSRPNPASLGRVPLLSLIHI